MALPIYAKSLFELMKFLGWEQQAIAERLGVSKSSISLWATGTRPISKRHEQPFLDLVIEILRDEQERAGVNSSHARELLTYIDAWVHEMYIKVGMFQRSVQLQFEILKSPLAKVDPMTLSNLERRTLRTACQRVVQLLDYLDSLGKPVRRVAQAQKEDPVAYFDSLRKTYREREP
jgi:transcriptional regulator with XRE-family HTH domain